MKRLIYVVPATGLMAIAIAGCGDDEPTGASLASCGDGQGSVVEFCRQVDHYEAGFGVPGLDVIVAECLVGPEGATVSNSKDGTYYCAGSYKLTSFPTATIGLHWGGSTTYSEYEEYHIPSPGEGRFSVKVTKESGGEGNVFLSMSSGANWMFDVVLVNTLCGGVAGTSLESPVQSSVISEARASISSSREGSLVRTVVPWSYTAIGEKQEVVTSELDSGTY